MRNVTSAPTMALPMTIPATAPDDIVLALAAVELAFAELAVLMPWVVDGVLMFILMCSRDLTGE
jgi:hypothetical protein